MTIYNDPDPPEHEYIIISAKDLEVAKKRMFIVDRAGLPNLPPPSHSVTTLPSMEKGKLTSSRSSSALDPPVIFPDPQRSIDKVQSLSTTTALQVVSESLDKDGDTRMNALDRVLGESYTIQSRYDKGQKALQFEPNSLTFFELMILAQVVHEFAPQYSTLEKNCFWFCNTVFDACKVIFGHRSRDDDNPQLHHWEILGRWNNLKVNQTTKQELRVIVHKFKSTYSQLIGEVRIVF